MTRSTLFCGLLWVTIPAVTFGQEPFVVTEAPNKTINVDGDLSDWRSLEGPNRVLNMSWAHNERSGAPDSDPLIIKIQYAWDADKFYTLVEEISDDDPSVGYNEIDWCGDCDDTDVTNPDLPANPAPWTTDSVGFYDKGIKWPGNPADPDADVQEIGPFSQWWVGLTTQEELVVDGQKQYRMMTRRLDESGVIDTGTTGQLIGPNSVENERSFPLIPDLPELTNPQSEAGVIEGPENGGRGRRFVEFYMQWDQIRYSMNDARQEVQDRIEILQPNLDGHFLEDVKEGYEFRLDPLLVDGTEDFTYGSQTHPSGMEHPGQTNDGIGADGVGDIAVVRLIGSPNVSGDVDADGDVDVADIDFLASAIRAGQTDAALDLNGDGSVNSADHTYLVKDIMNTYIGDADLNGEFNSSDLVAVLASGTYEADVAAVWSTGDFEGDGRTNSSDLVAALADGGYELGPRAATAAVPEPSAIGLLAVGALLFMRRR